MKTRKASRLGFLLLLGTLFGYFYVKTLVTSEDKISKPEASVDIKNILLKADPTWEKYINPKSDCPSEGFLVGRRVCNWTEEARIKNCVIYDLVRDGNLKFSTAVLQSTRCTVVAFISGEKFPFLVQANDSRLRVIEVNNNSLSDILRATFEERAFTHVDILHVELAEWEMATFLNRLKNGSNNTLVGHYLISVQRSYNSLLLMPWWLLNLTRAGLTHVETKFSLSDRLGVHFSLFNPAFDNKNRKSHELYTNPKYFKEEKLWTLLSEKTTCPSDKLEKLGGTGDGSKWVCNINVLPSNCVMYSFGVKGDSKFEAEILKRTNCTIFAFDPSDTKIGYPISPKNSRVTFQQIAVGKETTKTSLTFKDIMKEHGHTWVDFVKMDIEQGEYETLEKILDDFFDVPPIGQIVVEFHVWDWDSPFANKVIPLFNRLLEAGLAVYHSEANPVYPNLCWEYSLLNVNLNSNNSRV